MGAANEVEDHKPVADQKLSEDIKPHTHRKRHHEPQDNSSASSKRSSSSSSSSSTSSLSSDYGAISDSDGYEHESRERDREVEESLRRLHEHYQEEIAAHSE